MTHYTTTNANVNSASYRADQRPRSFTCDGLQFPCENAGRYRIVLNGPDYDRTPTYITMTLCEKCKAEWDSWQEARPCGK